MSENLNNDVSMNPPISTAIGECVYNSLNCERNAMFEKFAL